MEIKKYFVLNALCFMMFAASAANIAITPLVRSFDQSGGRAAIVTSGSGTWSASVSASWIHLESTDYTEAGYPVPYLVDANTSVESRTGYIYVSGNTHTINQAGIGATLSATSADFEQAGGRGSVTVYAPAGNGWHAKSNVDWITVKSSTGSGTASITFTVAAYNEISTRSGTLTIADNIFTVNQTGCPMALSSNSASTDYFAATVKFRVNALATTEWSVVPAVDWITVTDAGNGVGGDQVVLAVAENENVNKRTGAVAVGTETFTVTQFGRTNLKFSLDKSEFAAGADGASGERVAVTATPGLTWSAAADVDWIEFYSGYQSGESNGSVVYKVQANPTLYARSGTITVTAASELVAPKRITVTEAAATATLTMDGYEFEAEGETVAVGVATADIVGWSLVNTNSWLTITGAVANGPATLKLKAAANSTVYPRSGVVRIADHDFMVRQLGRGVTVDYEAQTFDTDGKINGADTENVITVTAASDVAWIAEASDPTWIIIYSGASGTGNGTVKYMVAPYVGDGTIRTGTITIGDKEVLISQRPYAASISPSASWVDGNAGAGEVQVSLDINAVWDVMLTDKSQGWLQVTVLSRNLATGTGKVAIKYTDNNTGKARSAVIVIAGETYTLTQAARQTVQIDAEIDGHGGSVEGAGSYDLGSAVTLKAIPDDGYEFVGWYRASTSMSTEPELSLTATNAAKYTASFAAAKPTLAIAEACLAGVTVEWSNLAWATEYEIYRSTESAIEAEGEQAMPASATLIATVQNDGSCRYTDAGGDENTAYWYWVNAVGPEEETLSNGMLATRAKKSFAIHYTNLRGATHSNRASYAEGESYTPAAPTARTGYTFLGWEPAEITAATSGEVTMRANWLQNTYTVKYDTQRVASIGDVAMCYGLYHDFTDVIPTSDDYEFNGWTLDGSNPFEVEEFKNLTDELNGVVTIYAMLDPLAIHIADGETEEYAMETADLVRCGKKFVVDAGGTLILTGDSQVHLYSQDLSNISGEGTIVLRSNSGFMSCPAVQFASTLSFEAHGEIPVADNYSEPVALEVRNLAGTANFRCDYGSKNNKTRLIRTTQTRCSEFSGKFAAANQGRNLALTVAGTGAAPSQNEMLTLSGVESAEHRLTIEANGCVKLSANANWRGEIVNDGLLVIAPPSGAVFNAEALTFSGNGQLLLDGAGTLDFGAAECPYTLAANPRGTLRFEVENAAGRRRLAEVADGFDPNAEGFAIEFTGSSAASRHMQLVVSDGVLYAVGDARPLRLFVR